MNALKGAPPSGPKKKKQVEADSDSGSDTEGDDGADGMDLYFLHMSHPFNCYSS